MKRLIAGMLTVCLLTGCTANTKDDSNVESEEEITEETLESVKETTTEETQTEATTTETEPSISYDYESYYIQTINDYLASYNGDASEINYNLIFINDDDIPELVIDHTYYNVSLYTYADGQVYTLMDRWGYGAMGNVGYEYLPRENALYNSNSDYAGAQRWETFMSISGNHDLTYSDNELHYQYFPEGVDPWDYEINFDVTYFFVNGQQVSEEVYNSYRVDGIYRMIEGSYTYDEIMEFLNSETTPKTSFYTLVMSDCTWLEAEAQCEAQGGHLATLNESDAYYIVNQLIENSNYPNAVFYIGGSYDEASADYRWTTDNSYDSIYEYYWRAGEPSYTGGTEDGRTVNEPYMCIAPWVNNGYNTLAFMDIPNDTLDAAPSYSGNLGYILEIEY